MKLKYLGTAAAEGWPAIFCDCDNCRKAMKRGGRHIRTRSQALVDDKLLLDFPADSLMHMLAYGIPMSELHTCLLYTSRCPLGLRVMAAGKDYFTDKAPLVSLEQLRQAKEMVKKTGRKYMVYYSERLHTESGVYADELIREGAIGKVLQVIGMGPHRLGAAGRPDWFFKKAQYGGILCDIGSHQIEQYLQYAGVKDAAVVRSQVANYAHPMYPELEDFGDAMLVGDNGTTNYFRVDWFTPDGLSTWGDGRTVILGTEGYIELRKYVNIGTEDGQDNVFVVNGKGEKKMNVHGKIGYPFFGQLILDCLNGTENAMTQEHAFKAAELCVKAQMQAVRIK